jgi:hypothetical protein
MNEEAISTIVLEEWGLRVSPPSLQRGEGGIVVLCCLFVIIRVT